MTPIQKVEVLRAACCVAGADGETSDTEMQLLKNLATSVGVGQASLTAMIERSESDPNFCGEQFRVLKDDPSGCIAVMLQVACVDGNVGPEEQQVLQRLSSNLGVPHDVFSQLLSH